MTIEIVDLPIKNGDVPWFFCTFTRGYFKKFLHFHGPHEMVKHGPLIQDLPVENVHTWPHGEMDEFWMMLKIMNRDEQWGEYMDYPKNCENNG